MSICKCLVDALINHPLSMSIAKQSYLQQGLYFLLCATLTKISSLVDLFYEKVADFIHTVPDSSHIFKCVMNRFIYMYGKIIYNEQSRSIRIMQNLC